MSFRGVLFFNFSPFFSGMISHDTEKKSLSQLSSLDNWKLEGMVLELGRRKQNHHLNI